MKLFMKNAKTICALVLSVGLVMSNSIVAFAAESDMDSEIGNLKPNLTYQDVLDMLNKEYGTNVHFPSAQECKEYGIAVEEIDVSIEEFEAQMRKDIEANLRANAEAIAAVQKLDTCQILESGSGVCKTTEDIDEFEAQMRKDIETNLRANAEAIAAVQKLDTCQILESGSGVCKTTEDNEVISCDVLQAKVIDGAIVYLDATVNNYTYWYYKSINGVDVSYSEDICTPPKFELSNYTYSLVDTRRTCALKLYGHTIGSWGAVIDENAYRYVEFWAGSGM